MAQKTPGTTSYRQNICPSEKMPFEKVTENFCMKSSEIYIRDPFVLRVDAEKCYYLFGTTDPNPYDEKNGVGFDCYRSSDLENWEGPAPVFRPETGFWATGHFWAPEVHFYRDAYYMFATFKSPDHCRGTQVLRSELPAGPYKPISDGPVTPEEWECLDGTLFVDENNAPWIIFCHEYLQITDGAICAMPLTADLSAPAGEVAVLFHASEAPWSVPFSGANNGWVTDGPFLYRQNGELRMLWSSFGKAGYAMGYAFSTTGHILGPWKQTAEPIFHADGGHGMRFTTFDGKTMFALHQPNEPFRSERPVFIPEADFKSNGNLI